ncbi:ribbon-helix-helix domain-containing protein [Myxosarcina sp. GI1(2024)]
MSTQKPKVSVYLAEDLKIKLQRLANIQSRSMANMAEVLIQDGIERAEESGELPKR